MGVPAFQGGTVLCQPALEGGAWVRCAELPDTGDSGDVPGRPSALRCCLSLANYAEHWCSLLKKTGTPFGRCHSAVDPAEYYKVGGVHSAPSLTRCLGAQWETAERVCACVSAACL